MPILTVLNLLNISNFALIDDLRVEFDRGLNLLTGETGSGKSIIVDALGLLIGGRVSSDLIKAGEARAYVEGLFTIQDPGELAGILEASGIEMTGDELIIRRELSSGGRNKIFINNQLATTATLRDIRPYLVDIHGQGDQQTLLNPETHLDLLDAYADLGNLRAETAERYKEMSGLRTELTAQKRDEAEKLQLLDMLRFQIEELERAALAPGEDDALDEERKRLNNVERLTALSAEGFALGYDESDSALARIVKIQRKVEELAEYDSSFRGYLDGLEAGRALIEDLAFTLRDFGRNLEFSPERLAEIENRLAEIFRLKRKYGGTIQDVTVHLEQVRQKLTELEQTDEREKELRARLQTATDNYLEVARRLHSRRLKAAPEFEKKIETNLTDLAMEQVRLQARIDSLSDRRGAEDGERPPDDKAATGEPRYSPRGIDRVEFYFSANPGEPVRPLARVASGGEASRLMLVLKTVADPARFPRTIVFDEIDTGVGGKVSEAIGAKLKRLSATNQVLCVTHQAQIARFADCHLVVRKELLNGRTAVAVDRLDKRTRVEEIARMLTGADITEAARRHARELLRAG